MDFGVDHPYPCSARRLHAVLTDRDYLLAKFPAIGFRDVAVIAASPAHVETHRTVQVPLPAFARKVLGETQTVTQVEDWSDDDGEGRIAGTFTGRARGTPVDVSGSITIEPDEPGCVLRIRGKASVKVPLVGGRIAGLVADTARKTLADEYAFTLTWLEQHRD